MSRKAGIVLVMASAFASMAIASFCPKTPMYVWNFTASAPVGLYRTLPLSSIEGEARGAWVAVEPSAALREEMTRLGVLAGGRLLVKRIAAGDGDVVCRQGFIVTINGVQRGVARARTSAGVVLPSWEGCHRLAAQEVFLLGQTENSFDGRYFGVTTSAEIVAPLRLVVAVGSTTR